jgi:hypothetical protein
MLMTLNPLPAGAYTCQGAPHPPLTIELPDKLGGRGLYDGGSFPPRPAAETRFPY